MNRDVRSINQTAPTQYQDIPSFPDQLEVIIANIECRLLDTKQFGDCTVVFGQVLHVAVDEAVLRNERPEITLLRPVARLGANEWSTIGEISSRRRIPFKELSG